jgi:hypothetical protein
VEIASHSSQIAFTKEFCLLDECVVSQGRPSCHRTVRMPECWEVVEVWVRNTHNLHRVTKSVKDGYVLSGICRITSYRQEAVVWWKSVEMRMTLDQMFS